MRCSTIQLNALFMGLLCFTTWAITIPVFGLTVHDEGHDESNLKQASRTESAEATEHLSDDNAQLKGNRGW